MPIIRLRSSLILSLSLLAFTQQAIAQRVECKLQEALPGLLNGECDGMGAESTIALQPMPGSPGDWTGAITKGSNVGLIDIVETQYGSQRHYVFRSTMDWFIISELVTTGAEGRLVFEQSDIAPPTDADVAILRRARRLIETSSEWDRSDDRNCDNDAQGVMGLYCALVRATFESMGKYYHRQPAMQRVRQAIDEQWRNRVTAHRLMDFNNHPDTTLDDVIAVLDRAQELIVRDMVEQ